MSPSSSPNLKIQKGNIRVLLAFDVGFEIRLSQISQIFSSRQRNTTRHRTTSRAWGRDTQPICLEYDSCEIFLLGRLRRFETQISFFDIGAISVELKTTLSDDFSELPHMAEAIVHSRDLLHAGREILQQIFKKASPAIIKPDAFPEPAVFTLFHIQELTEEIKVDKVIELMGAELAHTMRSSMESMSQNEAVRSLGTFVSYSDFDAVFCSENVGLILDQEETEEVLDVFELANVQLVELGFLDKTLEKVLMNLYEEKEQQKNIFKRVFRSSEREAEKLNSVHIDATLIMERVEQGFKIAQDPYLVRIHELCVQKRYLSSLVKALDRKLVAIRDIFSDQRSRTSNLRMEIMEIIIIVLISLEFLPMLERYLFLIKNKLFP
ncbi:MAG: hypothetical protein KA116_00080 [Proteobacteria bacterium]|nr:hypothetical protein [Pseudomonadota bacterium]